ncbi:unnamed protein product [Urochloa decumbens]|uniref:Uncharacterized protein n=1 Tax=Urochloa decumbens TaxID=240449 RepID=A0ABC9BEN3_9POAL
MVSPALVTAVHLACAFGVALRWAADLAGHSHELADEATTLPSGDSHAQAGGATVPLLLVSTTYFLTVTLLYLELAVIGNPAGRIAAQRLAAAAAKAAAVTSLLALSAVVCGGLWPYEI